MIDLPRSIWIDKYGNYYRNDLSEKEVPNSRLVEYVEASRVRWLLIRVLENSLLYPIPTYYRHLIMDFCDIPEDALKEEDWATQALKKYLTK